MAGAPLKVILERLVEAVEHRAPGLVASILLVEGGKLKHGAAPSLPEAYNRTADNHPIGEGLGSCGTAVHRGEIVVVEDTSTDPLWKNYREIARRYRLASCWSVPIFSSSQVVIGTFALYYHEPRPPRTEEVALVQEYADLAAAVIEYERTRQTLQARDDEHKDLLNDLEAIGWEATTDGRRFSFVSERALRLLGYPADRWTCGGGFWQSLLHPDDREVTLRRQREAMRGSGDFESEYRVLSATGDVVWMRDIVRVKSDSASGAPQLRGVMVNISRQREAEQEREELFRRLLDPNISERRRAEASWRLLADAGAVLGSSLDADALAEIVATLATRELADWCLVITRSDGGGLHCASFVHRDRAKAAPLAAEFERLLALPGGVPLRASAVLASGEAQLYSEIPMDAFEPGVAKPEVMRLMRSLGAESAMVVPLEARHRGPATTGGGVGSNILGVMIYVSSSPERHYLPRDLKVAEELAGRAALALANARLYHEAQAAVRHREEFLSIAAHELRTPLATLQLTIQSILLVLDSAPLNLDFLRGRALVGERQGVRLGRLINDLLDVSGIQSGQLRIQREEMDLVSAVQTVLGRLHEELRRKDIDVAVHAASPVVGHWDPDRIEQVITNLLTNAVKYGRRRPIRVGIHASAERATLEVEDEGIGMNADIQHRLFNPFERGVSAGHYGGLGLGLYITSQILRAHGGNISVRSTPDQGSTFTVELPRGRKEGPAAETGPAT